VTEALLTFMILQHCRLAPSSHLAFVNFQGNTESFAAGALRTVPTSDAHHPRQENARSYIKYYLRFSLSG
jgi:hypothetical protein